ncbi:Porphobilinogen deaminase [Caloramator mitchellensis]|uniref:Porphobilinogen deaminase n=1 Tax=Caloramator mitchellensis TaxID=908809 RepID=A0A0R3JXS2_CALMK|nr:hydroxymethylbilane synthase [Caloramator mitchellensis]KRQ85908.1 Porphobilinogen deaminase [Caloramator mitchellensis]
MIRVATRKSSLAEIQTDIVIDILKQKLNIDCVKHFYTTKGDKILDVSLDKIGGKGLFIKEIEIALLNGEVDIAVHSLKDVPTELEEQFEIVATPIREDARDAFVSMKGLKFQELKRGARIGTSSIRRAKMLKNLRDDIEIVPIRGNVQTRIDKIERENLDGVVLAAAGLKRLGLEGIITEYFDVDEMVPACGQGAIAVEILKSNPLKNLISKIDDEDVRICTAAERNIMTILKGGCHSAVGAYAKIINDKIEIIAVNDVDGRLKKGKITGDKKDYIKISEEIAKSLL